MRDYILAYKIVKGEVIIKAKSLDTDMTAEIRLPLVDLQYIANQKYQSEEWSIVP